MGPAWVSSLDVIARGQDPRSSILERLTPSFQLTLYDRLGTGLTGGEVTAPSLEASVRELEVVLDDLGGPVPVLAFSQGGPVAISLAVRRPDLVSAIVFFGSYADGPALFTNPELQESVTSLMEAHWGLGSRILADLFRPGASDQAAAHLSRVLRDSASGTVAATYLREVYEADVADLLPQVQVPCLVLHYRGDKVIPFGGAEQLVRGIPGARLVPLDGDVHVPDAHDLDRITQLIAEHLALVGPPA
jgi:pimeloyl-ACP methyl ester carboxylesterase